MLRRAGIVATCVLFLLAPTANGATNKQLRRQVSSLKAQVKTLKGKLAKVRTENGQLKGGVPDQVRAIAGEDNIDQLFNLVIVPALNAWPCKGSLFLGQTFYSADFNRRAEDGSCY